MDEHIRRRDVWGDDPEEVDASETVAELEVIEPDAARRWHFHGRNCNEDAGARGRLSDSGRGNICQ